jgi:hypothetical protein
MRELTIEEARDQMVDQRFFIIQSDGPEATRQSFLARYDGNIYKGTPALILCSIVIVAWIRK